MRKKLFIPLLLLCLFSFRGWSQNVAIKTNLLYDALTTANLGIEVGLAPHWSIDISGNYNNWKVDNQLMKHWMVQPEARYWFCSQLAGHFLAFHAIGGRYNFGHLKNTFDFLGTHFDKLRDHRAQGWGIGAGVAYGYTWILGEHWNFEAELGLGWIWTKYDTYECMGCGRKTETDRHHNYYGPTKLALNIAYVF